MNALKEFLCRFYQGMKEVLYGMFFYDTVRRLRKERADLEHLFILIAFGELLGLPILPPYYSLRLLPYTLPFLATWKRRLLREKDFTDRIG